MEIGCSYRFAAAMRLESYEGSCANYHGYDFNLDLFFRVSLPNATTTMQLDFVEVDSFVATEIEGRLDQVLLNDVIPDPTLERLACWIGQRVRAAFPGLQRLQISAGDRYHAIVLASDLATLDKGSVQQVL